MFSYNFMFLFSIGLVCFVCFYDEGCFNKCTEHENIELCTLLMSQRHYDCSCAVCTYDVRGEFCTHVSNCTKEFCPTGKSHLACHSGYCTCDADLIAIPCVLVDDCDAKGICLQPNTTQKCYGSTCQCVFNIDLPNQPGSVIG